jgi:uncharacterized membrane protein
MKENSELRAAARSQLKGGWGEAIGLMVIYGVLMSIACMVFGIGEIIVGGALTFGYLGYFSRKARGEDAMIENLFDGFKLFLPTFLLFLLQSIFIMLWTLLLFVPGIIKTLSYSMSFFILRDNPDIGASAAIKASRKMMNGHKGKLFGLYISFIGWILLSMVTFGIAMLWVTPYMTLTLANFYEDLKKTGPVTADSVQ